MQFLKALANGSPVYDVETLRSYVKDDLQIIRSVKPDLIIGDFRLSLSVSARVAQVPYAAITNAYWSPFYRPRRFPLPVLPMTRYLPIGIAEMLFRIAGPLVFPRHCSPLNQVRKEYGIESVGSDLRRVYTDADHIFYADEPSLFPVPEKPMHHHFLGPLLWSPSLPVPAQWDRFDPGKPTIYLTLGSSGSTMVAEQAYRAIDALGVNLIAATAGASFPASKNMRSVVTDYVPGDAAAARSRLVICNGGSPTSQQALDAGVPVLGIAGNMDQFMNMAGLVQAGVGCLMRADRINRKALQASIESMLDDEQMLLRARKCAQILRLNSLESAVKSTLLKISL